MNKFKVGLRTIKTGIAVVLCILVTKTLNHFDIQSEFFFSSITAVFSMQSSIQDTKKFGYQRVLGSAIGGIIAILTYSIYEKFFTNNFTSVFVFISIILGIHICNLLKMEKAIMVSCIVIIAIFASSSTNPMDYVFVRVFETTIGAVIAILVNRFILPPKI